MRINKHQLVAISFIFCQLAFSLTLASCSKDDDATEQTDGDGRRMRTLTIANAQMTRATIDPTTFGAAWATTDRPMYLNLSLLPSNNVYYGSLTPSVAGTSTTLTGSVYCGEGDNIAIVFPGFSGVDKNGESVSLPISLSGQKGTLADIGANFHYVYGVAPSVSVSDGTATGTVSEMKSLLSLCKFTFTNGGSPVNVKSVQIGWGKDGSVGYPNTGSLVIPLETPAASVVEADASDPLTVTLDESNAEGVVYVALFPCDSKLDFHFTVSDGTNSYTTTKNAKMLAGKYYDVAVAVE